MGLMVIQSKVWVLFCTLSTCLWLNQMVLERFVECFGWFDGNSIQWIVDADNTISNQFWTLLDEAYGSSSKYIVILRVKLTSRF
jgi:hypothetical protein